MLNFSRSNTIPIDHHKNGISKG